MAPQHFSMLKAAIAKAVEHLLAPLVAIAVGFALLHVGQEELGLLAIGGGLGILLPNLPAIRTRGGMHK